MIVKSDVGAARAEAARERMESEVEVVESFIVVDGSVGYVVVMGDMKRRYCVFGAYVYCLTVMLM